MPLTYDLSFFTFFTESRSWWFGSYPWQRMLATPLSRLGHDMGGPLGDLLTRRPVSAAAFTSSRDEWRHVTTDMTSLVHLSTPWRHVGTALVIHTYIQQTQYPPQQTAVFSCTKFTVPLLWYRVQQTITATVLLLQPLLQQTGRVLRTCCNCCMRDNCFHRLNTISDATSCGDWLQKLVSATVVPCVYRQNKNIIKNRHFPQKIRIGESH